MNIISFILQILEINKYTLEEYLELLGKVTDDTIIETISKGDYMYTGGECSFILENGDKGIHIEFELYFKDRNEKFIKKCAKKFVPTRKFKKSALDMLYYNKKCTYKIDPPILDT